MHVRKFDGVQGIYAILMYHHPGCIVITKGKMIFCIEQTWQTPYSSVQRWYHQCRDRLIPSLTMLFDVRLGKGFIACFCVSPVKNSEEILEFKLRAIA